MRDVAVVGVGMTHFGKFLERGLKDLAREAVEAALDSAGVDKKVIETAENPTQPREDSPNHFFVC